MRVSLTYRDTLMKEGFPPMSEWWMIDLMGQE